MLQVVVHRNLAVGLATGLALSILGMVVLGVLINLVKHAAGNRPNPMERARMMVQAGRPADAIRAALSGVVQAPWPFEPEGLDRADRAATRNILLAKLALEVADASVPRAVAPVQQLICALSESKAIIASARAADGAGLAAMRQRWVDACAPIEAARREAVAAVK